MTYDDEHTIDKQNSWPFANNEQAPRDNLAGLPTRLEHVVARLLLWRGRLDEAGEGA
jgi:hypothetical protein